MTVGTCVPGPPSCWVGEERAQLCPGAQGAPWGTSHGTLGRNPQWGPWVWMPVLPPETPAGCHHAQRVHFSCPLGLELWDSRGHPFCDSVPSAVSGNTLGLW